MLVSFLPCGAWVDDKAVVSVDEGLYENWFLPELNTRFITNDEGMPALLLGFDIWYDRLQGLLKISHATAINKFAHKHGLDSISSSEVPCSQELQKAIKAFKYANTPEEAEECEAIGGAYISHVPRCDGTLGADFDATIEGNNADRIEVHVEADKA
jgi:hypothetical protein